MLSFRPIGYNALSRSITAENRKCDNAGILMSPNYLSTGFFSLSHGPEGPLEYVV
jgi:hypothetical protein